MCLKEWAIIIRATFTTRLHCSRVIWGQSLSFELELAAAKAQGLMYTDVVWWRERQLLETDMGTGIIDT